MNHSTTTPSYSPHQTQSLHRCSLPGCNKAFNRKEHLTRHLKSHDPNRQYACPICGRRYARSDVLKRHVEHHAQGFGPAHASGACVSCYERQLKCDDSTPCRSCTRDSIGCVRDRTASPQEGPTPIRVDLSENSNNLANSNGLIPTTGDHEVSLNPALLHNSQQQWFEPGPGPWSLPIQSATDFIASTPGNLRGGDALTWPSDSSEHGQNADTMTVEIPQHTSYALPIAGVTHAEQLARPHTIDLSLTDRTATPSTSQSPASSISSPTDPILDLQNYLSSDAPTIKRLTQVYFVKIHPHWPILHAPSFGTVPIQYVTSASHVLLGSMLVLANWIDGRLDQMKLIRLVFDAIIASLLGCKGSFDRSPQPPSLHLLQGLLLSVVYYLCNIVGNLGVYRVISPLSRTWLMLKQSSDGMQARAIQFNSILISTCRQLAIFTGQQTSHDLGDYPFGFWTAQEQLHRLAFSVLRVDAYLSVLVGHPPSLRYPELSIPLPKSTYLWAADDDERRKFQWNEPAGREKVLFSLLMRNALDTARQLNLACQLSESDYHLGLCAMQVGVWEAAREAHCCEPDELLKDLDREGPIHLWRAHLKDWWKNMENEYQLKQRFFSEPSFNVDGDFVFAPLTLLLWHLSSLTLHAPLGLLQGQPCCFKCRPGADLAFQNINVRLKSWLGSKIARVAIWDAAQIIRIDAHQSASSPVDSRLMLNPLATICVLKSAIVVCTYAYHMRTCPVCTGGPPIDIVDLLSAEDGEPKLEQWKEQGDVLALWGPNMVHLCRCKVVQLATCFRRLLSRDKGAEREFVAFFARLSKA